MEEKSISIVVPVSHSLELFSRCLNSLKKYVNRNHQVFLINDNSCEADLIESTIEFEIKDYKNFHYFRNKVRLGFAKTCNKFLNEIDKTPNDILLLNSNVEIRENTTKELESVLNINEKHGIVCPRSNNAGILSIPFSTKDPDVKLNEAISCYDTIRNYIPRYSVIPFAPRLCMLIRRFLIENFGLFESDVPNMAHQEDEVCLKINKYGYSTVMANYAWVNNLQQDIKSFPNRHEKENFNLSFHATYPYFGNIKNMYLDIDMDPVDYFADVLCDNYYPKKKILFSLYNMLPFYSGSALQSLNLMDEFLEEYGDKYDIHILINRAADDFFSISKKHKNVRYPDTIKDRYHLAFSPTQFFHLEHLTLLNKYALKIMFTMLDIIAIRCLYIIAEQSEIKLFFNLSVKFADGIATISDFVAQDLVSYYTTNFYTDSLPKLKTIYLGINPVRKTKRELAARLPFEKYILIFGNEFFHKSLTEVLPVIEKDISHKNFIVIGGRKDLCTKKNVKIYPSGKLEEEFISALYENADALLFPSQYEGFGLPILEALQYGKPVIVYDNSLNRELFSSLLKDYRYNALFFDNFGSLPQLLNNLNRRMEDGSLKSLRHDFRNWKNVAVDVESFMQTLLDAPVDHKKLQERWFTINMMEEFNKKKIVSNIGRQSYAAQLFVDTGNGFNEKDSITKPVTTTEKLLEFGLNSFEKINNLRFDPLNDKVCVKFKNLELISKTGQTMKLSPSKCNSVYMKHNIFLFDTEDPQFEFVLNGASDKYLKARINLEYIFIGKEVYSYILRNGWRFIYLSSLRKRIIEFIAILKGYLTRYIKKRRLLYYVLRTILNRR